MNGRCTNSGLFYDWMQIAHVIGDGRHDWCKLARDVTKADGRRAVCSLLAAGGDCLRVPARLRFHRETEGSLSMSA